MTHVQHRQGRLLPWLYINANYSCLSCATSTENFVPIDRDFVFKLLFLVNSLHACGIADNFYQWT